MLIAINVGNSRVSLGGYEKDGRIFSAFIASDSRQTADFYACALQQMFYLHHVADRTLQGAVLSSVVPPLTPVLEKALRLLGVMDIVEVSSGVKTGLNIRSDVPQQVGADRVAMAVAARAKGQLPCVVVALGTATTFTVLDASGALTGSAILAGVQLSLAALRQQAAQLPAVAIEEPYAAEVAATRVMPGTHGNHKEYANRNHGNHGNRSTGLLARNTVDAMRVGAVYGAAALVDGMVARYGEALHASPYVLLTGSAAQLVTPYLRVPYVYDEYLLLDGLYGIWQKNRPYGSVGAASPQAPSPLKEKPSR